MKLGTCRFCHHLLNPAFTRQRRNMIIKQEDKICSGLDNGFCLCLNHVYCICARALYEVFQNQRTNKFRMIQDSGKTMPVSLRLCMGSKSKFVDAFTNLRKLTLNRCSNEMKMIE